MDVLKFVPFPSNPMVEMVKILPPPISFPKTPLQAPNSNFLHPPDLFPCIKETFPKPSKLRQSSFTPPPLPESLGIFLPQENPDRIVEVIYGVLDTFAVFSWNDSPLNSCIERYRPSWNSIKPVR